MTSLLKQKKKKKKKTSCWCWKHFKFWVYLYLESHFALTYAVCSRLICMHLTLQHKLTPKRFQLLHHPFTTFLQQTFTEQVLFTRPTATAGTGGKTTQSLLWESSWSGQEMSAPGSTVRHSVCLRPPRTDGRPSFNNTEGLPWAKRAGEGHRGT